MHMSINEIKSLIMETLNSINEEITVPSEIRRKSVEIMYYPPGTTRTESGSVNRKTYYIALDLSGNTVASGESEQEILRDIRRKFFYIRRKEGYGLSRDAKKSSPVGNTEYVSIQHGNVVAKTDIKGRWINPNE